MTDQKQQPTPKKSYVVEGEVEKVAQHEGNRYGIALDGQWYNGFGPAPCAQGDTVNISYEKVVKGGQEYRNVKQCTILEAAASAAPPASEPAATRNECINRSVALKAAVEFALGFAKSEDGADANLKFTLAVARRFERWLNCEDESNVLS